jgi:phage-related protein
MGNLMSLPDALNQDLIKPNQGNHWLWIAEFVVPGQPTRRIARNTDKVEYNGVEYPAANFNMGGQMVSSDGSIPTATIQVTDLKSTFERMINETQGAVGGTVQVVKVNSDFLTTAIPALEYNYEILQTGSDSDTVTFTLGIPNPLGQRFPLNQYSASVCPLATPSLFKGADCRYAGVDTACTGFWYDCLAKGNGPNWGGEHGLNKNTLSI